MEHSTGKIVKNTIIFTTALLVQKVIAFGNFLFLSSWLLPETLGAYIWALSFTTMFSIGADLGLSFIMMRDAAKNTRNDEKDLQNIIGLKVPLILFTLAACLITLFATKSDPQTIALVLISSTLMIFDAATVVFYSFLRAKQMLSYEAIGVVGFQLIAFVGSVFSILTGRGIVYVTAALALAGFVNLIYSIIAFRRKFKFSLRPRFDWPVIKYLFKLMPAFALSGIFVRIYNASDSVILGYLRDNASVGLFSVPAKVVTAFQALIPGVFTATIYPSMSNFYENSKEKLQNLFEKSFNYLSLISVPIALGLYVIAEPVLKLIWPKYIEATMTFKIMALALPFVFLAFPTGLLLRACDKQNINTINRGIIMVLSIILNIILVYYYGVLGAGITFLIVNIILLIADFIYIGKIVNYSAKHIFIYNLKILIAGFCMAFIVNLLLKYVSLYLSIGIGFSIFVLLALIFRLISKEDLTFLKEILKIKKNDGQAINNN